MSEHPRAADDTGKGADMAKRTCTVEGCGRDHYAHGICAFHYARLRRTGTVDARPKPPVQSFWTKVDKDGPVPRHRPDLGPCWLWTAGATAGGYGLWRLDGVPMYAHRHSYTELVGPIPDAYHIDHLCRVTKCVNPDHLEAVTPAENKLRGVSPNAINKRKTQCDHGHQFDAANTYVRASGGRQCRACARVLARRRVARVDGHAR